MCASDNGGRTCTRPTRSTATASWPGSITDHIGIELDAPSLQVYRYWGNAPRPSARQRGRYGWVEVPCDCPLTRPEGRTGGHRRAKA